MSAKARAQELARISIAAMRGGPLLAVSPQRSEEILATAFEQLIVAAQEACAEVRTEEREACAVIAETPHRATRGGGPPDPQRIAAAIRARGAS